MESNDSLPILTDLDFIFPTLRPLALEQPAEPVIILLSPPSISIPSNPASPGEQSDTASTTRGLSSVTGCSVATFTTDQPQIYTIASSVGNAKSKNLSSRRARARARARPKQRVLNLQQRTSKDFQKKGQTNNCSPTQTGMFRTTSEGREEASFQPPFVL